QRHLVANTLITSATEEQATATSDVAFFQRGESGWSVQVLGRYEDTLRLHGGAWRFHKRTTTYQA
ncbi:MAG: nuclear transport factor 2 family protein, partial [Hyphomicrobiales bacterium]